MSIELHCPGCQKLIRAPDNAGGRQGKCPYCERRVYIPMPEDDVELFKIAEPDETEREAEERLKRESAAYAAGVAHSDGPVPESAGSTGGDTLRAPPVPGEVVDVAGEVEAYLLAMRDSELDKADRAAANLGRAGQKAKDYIEGLMLDEMPPEFEGVPPPVMKGFLKSLLGRL